MTDRLAYDILRTMTIALYAVQGWLVTEYCVGDDAWNNKLRFEILSFRLSWCYARFGIRNKRSSAIAAVLLEGFIAKVWFAGSRCRRCNRSIERLVLDAKWKVSCFGCDIFWGCLEWSVFNMNHFMHGFATLGVLTMYKNKIASLKSIPARACLIVEPWLLFLLLLEDMSACIVYQVTKLKFATVRIRSTWLSAITLRARLHNECFRRLWGYEFKRGTVSAFMDLIVVLKG